ncbi:PDR/VanB family oxidoreductase [Hydrogenophaga sp.]|jgi:ferredoxin-NADP reductase|uniref:PDR/VanB family oxidoreductase n=1 Tax=Hydrogenophaga sp. TaxID=1904254 RepID=UPI002734CFB8|nr:PDR/VanB family oxidoreductase [Hydrogenophaga sp.]MDP3885078.1 PDR/VanB family oxidoreductase [Hydrogenophaga sp.]
MNGSSLQLRVVAAATLSPSLRHLQLASADGAPLPPTGAGAHVLFNLPGADRAHRNAYSLVNPPGSRSRYDIIVRRVAASRGGSAAVHERLKVGDVLQAQWPANLFAPVRRARHHLMIAGGIGITPFLSYLQDAGVRQTGCELHVCCREEERGVFAPWLPADAPVAFHWDAEGHRLDIAALLARQPAGTHLYVCGPSELNTSVLSAAAAAGWPSDQVHTEHFGSGASGGAPFEAVLKKSGRSVQVAEDESLLEAIERIGVAAPCLCRGGACGVCVTPLIEGEAEHRDHFLSPADQAAGRLIMPCVSRSRGARLVLDL